MGTLILKSSNALDANVESLDFTLYKQRVLNDGGFIADESAVKDAFDFIYTNNITESEIFSATSARWGVKLEAGKPRKLYSLFNELGDIEVTVGTPANIFYNTTTYAFPVIEMRGAISNVLETKGTVSNAKTSGVFVIAKAPILSTGGSYGAVASFALGSLYDTSASATAAESIDKRTNSLLYSRASANDLPGLWYYNAYGFGAQGSISTSTTLKDATIWSKAATYLGLSSMEIVANGQSIATDTTVIPNNYINNLKFRIGGMRDGAKAELAYTTPLYANFVESWCLVNTTSEKMKVLSLRSSQLYTS